MSLYVRCLMILLSCHVLAQTEPWSDEFVEFLMDYEALDDTELWDAWSPAPLPVDPATGKPMAVQAVDPDRSGATDE